MAEGAGTSTRSARRRAVAYAAWATGLCLVAGLAVAIAVVDERRDAERARSSSQSRTFTEVTPVAVPEETEPAEEQPVGSVVGTVTGTDGAPLAGVGVDVVTEPFDSWSTGPGKPTMPPGPTWSAATDEQGRYRIDDVTPGPHRVAFGSPGRRKRYAVSYNGAAATVDAAPDLYVLEDAETRVDAVVARAARLAGTVRAAGGQPLRDSVQVKARRLVDGAWVEVASATTRAGGRYVLETLAPGRYVVETLSQASGVVYHPTATRLPRAWKVVVDEGERVAGVDLDVPEPGTLSGRVLSANGEPMPGVWVNVNSGYQDYGRYGFMPLEQSRVRSDDQGRYEFERASGHHRVWVGPATTPTACQGILARTDDVRVDAGHATVRDVRLPVPARITGTVTDTDGDPLRGIEVSAGTADDSVCATSSTTGRDGRYVLDGLDPGRYRVMFAGSNERYFSTFLGGGTDPEGAGVVTVRPGRTVPGVDASLTEAGRITGRLDVRGLGAGGLTIIATRIEPDRVEVSHEAWGRIDADGDYRMVGLVEGTYRVTFWPTFEGGDQDTAEGVHLAEEGTTRDLADALELDVALGRTTTAPGTTLDLTGQVSGTVVDPGGRPRSDIEVAAYRHDPDPEPGAESEWEQVTTTWTDQDGRYTLRGLDGTYRIGFAGLHEFHPDVTEVEDADDLAVEPGEVVADVDAELAFEWD